MNSSTHRSVSGTMSATRALLSLSLLLALHSCMSDYARREECFAPISEDGCLLAVEEAHGIFDGSMAKMSGFSTNNDNRCNAIEALMHMGYAGFQMTNDGRNLDEILKNYYKIFTQK